MLNLVQLQERLKGIPMQALMQYANGANPQVPPFLALGELNRRKKMQESASAEQAQEMEGAPSVKDQIEQATGLMALQGNRQKQAAQQQAGVQANMPMAAPNTTTSEPAQMAGGGYIDDIVVPRDYQAGGMAQGIDPEMLKRLMMLKAMKQKPGLAGIAGQRAPQTRFNPGGMAIDPERLKAVMLKEAMQGDVADIPKELIAAARKSALRRAPGIPSLPMSQDMFRRGDYAGGGIVAFAGPTGSFVEQSPGFYQLSEEVPSEEKAPANIQEFFMDLLRRQKERKSLPERLKEAGLETPPQTGTEELAELQKTLTGQQAKAPMDQLMEMLGGIATARGGNWATQGAQGAMAARKLAAQQEAGMTAAQKQIAQIKDLRTKAAYDAARGNIKDAQAEEDAANKAELDIISKMGESEYKAALGRQAEQGKITNFSQLMEIIDEAKRNPTPENVRRMNSAITAAGYVTYAAPRVEATERGTVAANERAAIKEYSDLFDAKKMLYGPLSDEMDAAAARDKKEGTGTQYQNQIRLREYNRIREGLSLPPASVLPGTAPSGSVGPAKTPPPPPGFVPQR